MVINNNDRNQIDETDWSLKGKCADEGQGVKH